MVSGGGLAGKPVSPNWVKSEMVITIAQDVKGCWFESSLTLNIIRTPLVGQNMLYCKIQTEM